MSPENAESYLAQIEEQAKSAGLSIEYDMDCDPLDGKKVSLASLPHHAPTNPKGRG